MAEEHSNGGIVVLIVDDHAIVRDGLRRLLEGADGIVPIEPVAGGTEAIARIREGGIDVVLMDLSMPNMDGVEATRRIVALPGAPSVVVLTSIPDREQVIAALDAGAKGYLLKDAEPDEIVRGIHAVMAGGSPLDPRAGRVLLTARSANREVALTAREREVLALIAQGLPNKRIAVQLAISEKTVKAHITRIFQTLSVTDRTQAALWAQRNGVS